MQPTRDARRTAVGAVERPHVVQADLMGSGEQQVGFTHEVGFSCLTL